MFATSAKSCPQRSTERHSSLSRYALDWCPPQQRDPCPRVGICTNTQRSRRPQLSDPLPSERDSSEPGPAFIAVSIEGETARVAVPKQTMHARFRVINHGTTTLAPASAGGYALGYRWLDDAGTTVFEGTRSPLQDALGIGETVELPLVIVAPPDLGTYQLCVTLVQEGVAWLDQIDASNALMCEVVLYADDDATSFENGLARRFPTPMEPYGGAYTNVRRALIEYAIDDGLASFRRGGDLPQGYGIGVDERAVEYPWLLAQHLAGRILDAGSTLNHREIIERVLPRAEEVHVVTLEPEDDAYWQLRVSYVYGDLRDLPYRDGWFDSAACISTLEHVGMDNSVYGNNQSRHADPYAEQLRAVQELVRVVRPGGQIFVTVPYGAFADHGWQVTLDRARIDRLLSVVGADETSVDVFRYTHSGWTWSSLAEAADARTRDSRTEPIGDDLRVGAGAVACLRLAR
jgi:SAM-dependent methyltransferase